MDGPRRRREESAGRERRPDAQPLYAQVREILTGRIRSGQWTPGQALPSEHEIAAELGVSQGTVRKALDAMTAEHLLVRRQGRGTFVMQHTPASMLFRFFNFYDESGSRIEPDSREARAVKAVATAEERARLALVREARVVRITRLRLNVGRPLMTETIVVPARLFPGLEAEAQIPNTLYDYYQSRFGITVARGEERITAVLAGPAEARALGVAEGAALLKVDRVMLSLDGLRIEWRVSLCRQEGVHYRAEVG